MTIIMPTIPYTIPEAIAREEGFYVEGSRARRNNNPGNIEIGSLAMAHRAEKGDPRFAIFPTASDGWQCLKTLLTYLYRGKTVGQMLSSYAPASENFTSMYIKNVCAWAEVTPETIIDGYIYENNKAKTLQETT